MAEPKSHVLIVEDDEDIASALSRGLEREGYRTTMAHNATAAGELAADGCDAMIVDVMLGEESGIGLVERLRAVGVDAPIIMLSALSGVDDRARGLAAGADDYVAKPFEFIELVARLRVQQRRRTEESARPTGLSAMRYDPETRELAFGDVRIGLTEREGELLSYLAARAGKVVNRWDIFDTLWAGHGGSSENVVDVYIGYLRRKLAPLSDFGIAIRTVRGRGFMLTETKND